MVGKPHRSQAFQFELFKPLLVFKLSAHFSVEPLEAVVSQSAVPPTPRKCTCFRGFVIMAAITAPIPAFAQCSPFMPGSFTHLFSCISAFLLDSFPANSDIRAFPFDSFLIRFVSCRFRTYTLRFVS